MTLRPIPRPTKKGSWWLFQLLPTGAVLVAVAVGIVIGMSVYLGLEP